jgi:ketosteroid isomerase-like protein
MAEIIKTDGTCQPVQPTNGTDFTLEEMQAIVGGDIELVYLNDTEIMVVNEDGKNNSLDLNHEATRVFRKNYPDSDDYIVGNVLVCDDEQIR